MSGRVANITCEQRSLLIEFLKQKPKLLSGKFSNEFTFKHAQILWQTITQELNAIPGAKKDWRQWRKTWQDMRTKTKSKRAKIAKYANGTGGGEPSKDVLTPSEIKIVDLISPVEIDGHLVLESTTDFEYDFGGMEIIYEENMPLDSSTKPPISHPTISGIQNTNIDDAAAVVDSDMLRRKKTDYTPTKDKTMTQTKNCVSQRILQSTKATDRLAAACEKKIDLKANYYEQKLKLLQDKNKIMESLVKCLQEVSNKLKL